MGETVQIPGLFGIANHIGETVIDSLIDDHKLPADFRFRLLGIEPDMRETIATKDVLAVMGYGEKSGYDYLEGPLPACVWVAGIKSVEGVLSEVSEDYYTHHDIVQTARGIGIAEYVAAQSWRMYTRHFNQAVFIKLNAIIQPPMGEPRHNFSKQFRMSTSLRRTVMSDDALMKVRRRDITIDNHGPVHRRLLTNLLVMNHPELSLEMD
jgi:hypothetical protein